MVIILVAVFVVMLAMNGALFYVLFTAVKSTKKQVNSCFVKELEDYNDYLNEKKEESKQQELEKKELKKEVDNLQGVIQSLQTSSFYAPRPIPQDLFIPTARYMDNEFFEYHRMVNERMGNVDYMDVVKRIQETYNYDGNRERYDIASKILEFLDVDTAYEICTLEPEMQAKVLEENLNEKELLLLQEYASGIEDIEDFDVLDFRTFIREIRTNEDPVTYVRTGHEENTLFDETEELQHEYDDNISEGVKIIFQNRVYDYSIYRLRSGK